MIIDTAHIIVLNILDSKAIFVTKLDINKLIRLILIY
jgi:hypothetical protein